MNAAVFEENANAWWDNEGVFKPLHSMNPLRVEFILKYAHAHFKRMDINDLTILDVGCGGGLLCEPLARLGGKVTGIDLSPGAIEVARDHACAHHLNIHYRNGNMENMGEETFDIVIASEVIEHVENQGEFIKNLARRVRPGGCFVITTLNRTLKSKIFGIYVAEYILRFAPIGTHEHRLFLQPSELFHLCEKEGLKVTQLEGLSFNPRTWNFALSKDMDINYFAFGER